MKIKVSKILEFCQETQKLTGKDDPEVTYDAVIEALFPMWWKLDNYYLHRDRRSDDDDSDCYCE